VILIKQTCDILDNAVSILIQQSVKQSVRGNPT